MAGRFQASKFKNTHPKTPKREDCVTDLPIGGLSCTNNGIQAGRTFLAFHVDGEGGKLGVLPQDARGRKTREDLTIICAHTEPVNDFAFVPFHNDLLATVAKGEEMKLWRLGAGEEVGTLGDPTGTVSLGEMGGECIAVHPNAADILAVGSNNGAFIVDLASHSVHSEMRMGSGEKAQSASWMGEGVEVVVQDRGNGLFLFDPRAGADPALSTTDVHQGKGREGRVLVLGNEGKVITSGFSKMRAREVFLYDRRKFATPMHVQPFEQSTGLLIPLYDPDTKLIFLAGKGSNKVNLCELLNKPPYFGEVGANSPTEQTLGACLLPKWSLDVMNGEVARCVQLTRNALFPISCVVPRKSYRDFIPELYPATVSLTPGAKGAKWLGGDNATAPRYSLDPEEARKVDKEPFKPQTSRPLAANVTASQVLDRKPPPPLSPKTDEDPDEEGKDTEISEPTSNGTTNGSNGHVNGNTLLPKKEVTFRTEHISNGNDGEKENGTTTPPKIDIFESYADRPKSEFVPLPAPKVALRSTTDGAAAAPASNRNTIAVTPGNSLFGSRRTKFKHTAVKLETTKQKIFYNLRKVNSALPLECGGFTVSRRWAAVPMAGSAGLVAVFDLNEPQKVPDGLIPGLENGASLGDLKWDPFDESRILIGLDSGVLNLWTVPDEGITELCTEPQRTWNGHGSKVLSVEWNPVARNVVATASMDGEVVVWDLSGPEAVARVRLPHPKPALTLSWSSNGDRLATAAKDGLVRVFAPLSSTQPIKAFSRSIRDTRETNWIQEAKILGSVKAARLVWVVNDQFLLLSGFSRSSQREVSLLRSETLEEVTKRAFDQSSVLLIPNYDFDTNIVFLTGKGDVSVHMFEVIDESPWFLDIPSFKDRVPHQGLSFHTKRECETGRVEFMRCWRLTLAEIQPMSFTVPRRYTDKYQNDIFPAAIALWNPACTAKQWFGGDSPGPKFENLKPDNMEVLYPEEAAAATPAAKARPAPVPHIPRPPPQETTKEDLVSAMVSKMEDIEEDGGLEQDKMEGVAEEEWEGESHS